MNQKQIAEFWFGNTHTCVYIYIEREIESNWMGVLCKLSFKEIRELHRNKMKFLVYAESVSVALKPAS